MSLVKSTLNVGVTSFHAKMSKLSLVGIFEFHEYVGANRRTMMSEMINDLRTWCFLCFHCQVVKPFNGIGVFYGRFVKDFATHMSIVGFVMTNGIRMYCSYMGSRELYLLEELCEAYFDKNLMMLIMPLHKLRMHEFVLCLHVVHEGLWIHCSLIFVNIFKLLGQWNEIHFDELGLLVDIPSCKLDVNCDEPTLCVKYELVNLWSSKDDVSMVPYDLSLHDLVIMPILFNLNVGSYEDPFSCMPSLDDSAKSFVKMFKNLGTICTGMIEPNKNKVLGAYVTWHVNFLYCM